MMENYQVRFGGGRMEKGAAGFPPLPLQYGLMNPGISRELASRLPNLLVCRVVAGVWPRLFRMDGSAPAASSSATISRCSACFPAVPGAPVHRTARCSGVEPDRRQV